VVAEYDGLSEGCGVPTVLCGKKLPPSAMFIMLCCFCSVAVCSSVVFVCVILCVVLLFVPLLCCCLVFGVLVS